MDFIQDNILWVLSVVFFGGGGWVMIYLHHGWIKTLFERTGKVDVLEEKVLNSEVRSLDNQNRLNGLDRKQDITDLRLTNIEKNTSETHAMVLSLVHEMRNGKSRRDDREDD